MWWQQFLEGLGDLVAGLGRNVARFYAETRVGATRKLFFINPIVPNDLDTDGLGGADLRIWIVPTLAVPPDGLTITFQRLVEARPDCRLCCTSAWTTASTRSGHHPHICSSPSSALKHNRARWRPRNSNLPSVSHRRPI